MISDHPQRDYRNLRVLIMGLGSFGGGLGVVRFFVDRGASVTVTDTRSAEQLADTLRDLEGLGQVRFQLGRHDPQDFKDAELIAVNPAVKPDNPYLKIARSAGVPLTSEMNLFWQWNPAPVVAVTGSNGKSTTTALIHAMLKETGRRCWLGGNIGISLLPDVSQIGPGDAVVLELSSFQLTDLNRLQVSPAVSVVTNFAPNHLDWHTSLDDYRWAKQTMLRWQRPADVSILNADDPDVRNWPSAGQRMEFGFTDTGADGVFAVEDQVLVRQSSRVYGLPLQDWLRLPGRHNLANALAATCAAIQMGADERAIQRGVQNYQPLPHRLQWVAEIDGRSYYNDSLATTPESAIVALEAFTAPIVVLAGGYDKHVDLSQMAAAIAHRARAAALMGQTAESLRTKIRSIPGSQCVTSPELASFDAAFKWAVTQSRPGDVILLSPGCASYDWFRNFADRGTQFTEFVQALRRPSDGTP